MHLCIYCHRLWLFQTATKCCTIHRFFFGLRTNLFVINLVHLFNADRAWAKIDHKWGVMHFKQFYAEQGVFLKHFHFI